MAELHVIGVRHHSPACARLVRDTIGSVRPRWVLVEGPADMNERIGELDLPHRLPVAIFSYYQDDERSHASFAPFCAYSPEWVAIRAAREVGAEVRFMDLPAWAKALRGVENRYADRFRMRLGYVQALCERTGADGIDALWDHLFEQPLPPEELGARLASYFDSLRDSEPDDARDRAREAFMSRAIAWAMAQGGDVVAVCGGFHRPRLVHGWREAPAVWPELPTPAKKARHGSYLVPYSFRRLDSFAGYQAGMPSPEFYQLVWEQGADAACARMFEELTVRLRRRNQPVSTADLVGCWSMAVGLMRLRRHGAMTRADLLDGIAAGLVKDALEAPLPWSERGALWPGTDPLLCEVIAAFSGEREGELAAETPRPPLVADVVATLARLDLEPAAAPRVISLDLVEATGREGSRALHSLRVLEIPGFERLAGPGGRRAALGMRLDERLVETWEIRQSSHLDAALIEASAFGATLELAVEARIEVAVSAAGNDLRALGKSIAMALWVGLDRLADRAVQAAVEQVELETRLERLGATLADLLALWRHDAVFGVASSSKLAVLIEAMVARGLWLYEGLAGATAAANEGQLAAALALRDAFRYGAGELELDLDAACGVMRRRVADASAPPALRGAAIGFSWSLGDVASGDEALARAAAVIREASAPARLGDFLAGLFALAREEIAGLGGEAGDLVLALDDVIAGMQEDDFLAALPALRLAFNWFPPREKDRIARALSSRYGAGAGAGARQRLPAAARTIAAGASLDDRMSELETRFGLMPDTEEGDR